MPQRTAAIVATVVLLFGLTACAATPDAVPPADESQSTSQEAPEAVSESPEPLVAEEPQQNASDAAFLTGVRENLPPKTGIANATDEQLLAAGQEACDRLDAGEPSEEIVLVEGEEAWENGIYYDSSAIITSARMHLCPA